MIVHFHHFGYRVIDGADGSTRSVAMDAPPRVGDRVTFGQDSLNDDFEVSAVLWHIPPVSEPDIRPTATVSLR